MSAANAKTTGPEPADVARLAHCLTVAGEALRELLVLLPVANHRMAIELAAAGATCDPVPDDIADAARTIARFADLERTRRAPVLHLAGGAA